ncbi:adenosylcobinamide kinase/adenosylcobinamide phosphate guanyltransferase [Anaerocolumna cellulosilytica]|uniref:Adenosylcobinamide kinase n=1 Tax=Anaerocolumna cellulosilytica TaxID=433286 RepID=A0A6S6QYV2_9FIRM|nr:bifunctional adenosylcobinamide kinase/adenosylcobinamide-phosphate guanylyltransferase [Anaerocolumna cellulosilytica]MBB5196365.1 adenosylcobinamide kinase/adenosylcobinamide-phosphate guanylyltransferase [Anaerocolumna cellulosilytica]BCJ96393.1 adenosylcobinamide kinase/adenosylcobinamide phosphate guanyltransferase [Anaerocolumna cellulosilytica]
MLIVVTGGSGSGKSVYAENYSENFSTKMLYYIATMMPYDTECLERIKRHQFQRKEKGFTTLECYKDLETVNLEPNSTVLLECMSNLLANVMFSEDKIIANEAENSNKNVKDCICDYILNGINHLIVHVENLIVVTNEVFSDNGSEYKETMEYIQALGEINQRLALKADRVYEVVCGIPVLLKG